MCEWTVYHMKNEVKELVMENASLVQALDGEVKVEGLFSQGVLISGRIRTVDSERHEIIIS